MVWNFFLEERVEALDRVFVQFIMAVNYRLKVFEFSEGREKFCHLAIVYAAVVEAHPIDFVLEELSSTIQSLAVASA